MLEDLKNKNILVTGAGDGIGNALCKKLSAAGVNVIAVARCSEQLVQLKNEYPSIQTILVDLQDWNTTRKCLEAAPELDGLVNNAAIAIIKPFAKFTEKEFDDTFNVNIKAVFNVTQALLPKLKDGASIVMVSSLAASRSFDGHAVYSATKAAVDSLTKSLALELGPRKIRVNSVNPTVVMTKMSIKNWSDPKKSGPLLDRIPLRRFGEVDEIVHGIIFLLSSQSSFTNGLHLNLEGGYSVS